MAEQWKEIAGESGYFVSDQGEVLSSNYRRTGKSAVMKQSTVKGGYKVVNIGGCLYTVHKLVAQAFVPNINDYTDITHKNGNVEDNRAANLEWIYHNQSRSKTS